MKPSPHINGVSLMEFFPLLAKLGQQLRMPVVALSIKTVGVGRCTDIGMVEYTAVSIGHGGNASQYCLKLAPGFSGPDVRSIGGGAQDFLTIYDAVSKIFATSLVFGYGSALYDVPVIYGQMVRYGLPIISARNQVDLFDVWKKTAKTDSTLSDVAKHYNVEHSTIDALVAARVLETMLWRHGSESILAEIKSSRLSYLTPELVAQAPDPMVVPVTSSQQGTAATQSHLASSKKTARRPAAENALREPASSKREPSTEALRQEINKVIDRHGLVRPVHLPEIAAALAWSEAKTSIQIGMLITQGKINAKPFVIPEQQAVLELHLPIVLKSMQEVKLKPIREAIQRTTGHDVEFIQIRLALKTLGVRLE